MGDETNKVTIAEVRAAFREESEGLLAKLEKKPEPAVVLQQDTEARLAQEASEGKADMRAPALGGIVEGLDGIRVPVLNIALPVGSALIGGVTGMVIGDVIDIVLPPPLNSQGRPTMNLSPKSLLNVGVQVGGAAATLKWGPGMIGGSASKFAVGLMALRLLLRVPAVTALIDTLGSAIATPLAGLVPDSLTAAQGYQARQDAQARQYAVAQAEQVIYGEDQFKEVL